MATGAGSAWPPAGVVRPPVAPQVAVASVCPALGWVRQVFYGCKVVPLQYCMIAEF